MMEEKQCAICGMFKFINYFPTGYQTTDGTGPYCKTCNSANRKEWREKNRARANLQSLNYSHANITKVKKWKLKFKENNRERLRIESAAYRKEKPWQHTQAEAKRRAKKRSSIIESDLALVKEIYRLAKSELIINCEYCGLETDVKNRHVDHKVPLAISCDKCNLRKGAKLLHEFGGAS
jgi:hypothetical protein